MESGKELSPQGPVPISGQLHAGQGFGQGSQGLLSKVQLTMMAMARGGHQDQRGDEGGKTGVNGVEYIEWYRS